MGYALAGHDPHESSLASLGITPASSQGKHAWGPPPNYSEFEGIQPLFRTRFSEKGGWVSFTPPCSAAVKFEHTSPFSGKAKPRRHPPWVIHAL